MSNEMIAFDLTQLPSTYVGDVEVFDDLSRGGNYLQRIQLCGKGKYVEQGLVKPGHYAVPISDSEAIDLGAQIDILPLARRPKALDTSDRPAISVYDPTSKEFARIRTMSEVKDSGCQFGTSFLVVERSTGKPYEYFMGAPTHRPEAQKIFPFMALNEAMIEALAKAGKDVSKLQPHGPLPVTMTARYTKGKKFSWYIPVVLECSTPFNVPKNAMQLITEFLTRDPKVEGEGEQEPNEKRRAI